MKRSKGTLSKRSRSFKKKKHGNLSATRLIKDFSEGDKVVIVPKPYFTEGGIPHLRYRGRVGKVIEKRGNCYVVEIKDGGKHKKIISNPVHLEKASSIGK